MTKIKNLFRRIKTASFKRMFNNIEVVHNETGISKIIIFFDMLYCGLFKNIGYLDYFIFGFAGKPKSKRKTYMTYNHNTSLFKMVDDEKLSYLLKDKLAFNKHYKDYIGRNFFDPKEGDLEEFKKFVSDNKELFIKPADSFGGLGIYKPVLINDETNVEELYDYLKNNHLFLEGLIKQNEKMASLNPTSINTVRIVTLVVDNKPHFMYAVLRMGVNGMLVDNSSSGGLNTVLDENGRIAKACFCDKTLSYYTVHPTTNMNLVGFEVPMFKQAVDLCLKAAMVEPSLGYIGWDIAISDSGPVIVEANDLPGYDMCQNHGTNNSDLGILPKFEEVLGRKII